MKPYGREKNLKGGKPWKLDYHPKKGYINWWETMVDFLSRSTIKQNYKKSIEEELFNLEQELDIPYKDRYYKIKKPI